MLNNATVADERPAAFVDTRVKPHVRVLNASLDEDPNSPNAIILNGRLDPATLRFLKVDTEYQRPLGDRPDIFTALKAGTIVPNIDIGVRGQDFETDGDDFIIRSPAYIIDGWQRIGTALRILEDTPDLPIRIFATLHFGTESLWERHRFTELNKNVKKVSANLHFRNMRDSNEAVLTLFGLSNNTRDFVLYKKVCWSQNMKRDELVSATQLARTARMLHAHQTPFAGRRGKGQPSSNSVEGIASAIQRAASAVTLPVFRKNMSTFFSVVDECWGIRSVEYKTGAPQIKTTFMGELARFFSAHQDFWNAAGKALQVNASFRRKLAAFPIRDPQVAALAGAGSGGVSARMLNQLIVTHMNSGKRTNRLRSRFES